MVPIKALVEVPLACWSYVIILVDPAVLGLAVDEVGASLPYSTNECPADELPLPSINCETTGASSTQRRKTGSSLETASLNGRSSLPARRFWSQAAYGSFDGIAPEQDNVRLWYESRQVDGGDRIS